MSSDILEIATIVAGGDGLARRPERPVVFVPRTAPGERVEVEYTEERRQWARARVTQILLASPERRDPPCPHYASCGGCQLQHLRYEAQLPIKAAIVADALRRIGGITFEPPEVVPAARPFGYRNRVSFVLRRTSTGVFAGYHGFEKPRRIVDVDRCPLAEEAVNRVWGALRAAWGPDAGLLPPGHELRLTLRASSYDAVGLSIERAEGRGDPESLLGRVEGLEAIWSIGPDGMIDWHVGASELPDRWGTHELRLAGKAFVQVNREVSEKLEEYVLAQCGDVAGLRVVDAYCGFGLRAVELAIAGAAVSAIDADHQAIAAGQAAAVEAAAAVRFIPDSVEQALPRLLPTELLILNPPRRGVAGSVVESLLAAPPTRVIYVSCDPATLARDLKLLSPKYTLTECRAFDMFPQTAHAETVATLDRAASA